MKYFRYWIKEPFEIEIDGSTEKVNVLSGSNISKSDALDKAKARSKVIENIINSGEYEREYETTIKEHVEEVIDDANIITICRYGAKILNTTQYTILDLDDYPFDFFDLFRPIKKLPKKERIIAKFLERLKKTPELGSDFRIYETAKGIRIIGNKYIDPSSNGYRSLMRKFNVDWLYIILSTEQNCYRARTTPKPHRMKFKSMKISNPLTCESEKYKEWATEYARSSERYSTVNFVKSIGKEFYNDPIIQLHDKTCNATRNYPLA